MAVLRPKATEKETTRITATIPADLAKEVDEVKADAERQGFEFPVADIVTDALRKAVKAARKQLAASGRDAVGT
jgi:metal-responsive CopG/Arc/MetJ family transcriptional regulator